MATIDRFTSRAEAELACGLLSAHGIEAFVRGDDAGGAYPQLPFGMGGMVVVVPDELLDEARELLDGPENGASTVSASTTSTSTSVATSPPHRPGWLRVLLLLIVALVVLVTFLQTAARLLG